VPSLPTSDSASLDDVERELGRVVDRLMSMPLNRVEGAAADVRTAADILLEQTRLIDAGIPPHVVIPDLAPQGQGPLIAVLGDDWLAAARASSTPDCGPVLDALVTLRRALP
jgi:hypothetical protein